MKQIVFILGLLISASSYCQTYPQYWFYSTYDVSSLTNGVSNCADEAECIEYALNLYDIVNKDNIDDNDAFIAAMYVGLINYFNNGGKVKDSNMDSILCNVASLNDRQRIDLIDRLYEIENSCYIKYNTIDSQNLNFVTQDEDDKVLYLTPVDFGAPLIRNSQIDGNEYVLKFANPVTIIDANLFNDNVTSISLPKSKDLVYLNNARKSVSNLAYLEGADVLSNRALVKDGVLIVAAVSDLSVYFVPDCVVTLGEDCLRKSGLTSIVVPESVHYIQSGAFEDCRYLNELFLLGNSIVNIDRNAFDEMDSAQWAIYVPESTIKLYKKQYPYLKKRFKKVSSH